MIELDLNQILEGTHTDLFSVDQVTGQCNCGEYVGQNQHLCPYCKEPVSWKHSKLWTRTFLEGEADNFAKSFLKRVGIKKFKDGREYHRWRLVHLAFSHEKVMSTVGDCRAKLKRMGNRYTGRAVISYALNTLEKELPAHIVPVEEGTILGRVGDPD